MVAFNASYDDYKTVMGASGLDSEFASPLYRTAEEYNAIVDVWAKEAEAVAKGGSASGAWRPMVEALVAKCRAKRAELEAAEAARKRKAKSDAELEAAAALAARVTKSEQRMRDALELSKNFGNPLNNRTLGNAAMPGANLLAGRHEVSGSRHARDAAGVFAAGRGANSKGGRGGGALP